MKRRPELARLSRDHHQALVVAQSLRRATSETAAEARARFLEYWDGHGRRHFQLEEELLLPAFARHGDPADPLVVQTLVEHVAIRRDADSLAHDPGVNELHELGERLGAHVRHEERRLFPLIEQALPPDELAALAAQLACAESAR